MWYKKEGLRIYGSWEPLSFRIRRASEKNYPIEDIYEWEHSEDFIKGLKKQGYNLYITHLSKGHGIKEETEDRKDTKKIVDLCHKHGLKAGGYIRYTNIAPETMEGEVPGCLDKFAAKPGGGRQSKYNVQYWRYLPCSTSQKFLNYIDKIIAIGINEIGIDCLHVDGLRIPCEPYACHCERCVGEFKKWIYDRYPTKSVRKKRFGISEFYHIEPPDYILNQKIDFQMPVVSDPVAQEWMFFKCHLLTNIWNFIVNAAVSRNPECLVQGNTTLHPGVNSAFFASADIYSLSKSGCHGLFSEEGNYPYISKQGYIPGHFQTFKKLSILGLTTFTYNRGLHTESLENNDSESVKLCLAHQMACNCDCCGVTVGTKPGKVPVSDTNYLLFHNRQRVLFKNTSPVYDTALYYSSATRRLNSGTPIASSLIVSNLLIKNHIPFNYLFAENISDINKYKAVILPEIECMTDKETTALKKYVKSGGGLIILGKYTGKYDAHRKLYKKNILQEALNIKWNDKTVSFTKRLGKGRISFINELTFAETDINNLVLDEFNKTDPYSYLDFKDWPIPLNSSELIHHLNWGAEGHLFTCELPGTVAVEYKEKEGKYFIHLVNFDINNDVGEFEIKCNEFEVQKAEIFTPDDVNIDLKVLACGNRKNILKVSGFQRYLIIVIRGA